MSRRLIDLTNGKDCGLYIIDTKIPDIGLWPAPLLMDPGARSKTWVFLLSRIPDISSLGTLPMNSMFFERTDQEIDTLVSFVIKLLDPEENRKIERVSYVEGIRSFLVRMGSGRVYMLSVDDLPEADSSSVVRYRIGRNRSYFRVCQESGNWFEIPWDDILYHCEPEYEHYRGKTVAETDRKHLLPPPRKRRS